jgi:predicted GTPase
VVIVRKVIIMGAAGRDFHNFNVFFRQNKDYRVVAFTATQIPFIEKRTYPGELSGPLYPEGIPIYPEEKLGEIVKKEGADIVVFAYSDISHEEVMHKASAALSLGCDFWLMGPKNTMLKSNKPVISVCAVRTGCGKSPTSRKVIEILKSGGLKPVLVRHPMPYDPNLSTQILQRYETYDDLDKYNCTIEEREEYEPHIRRGIVVYAGVDYEKILKEAEKEGDVIVWDGGNNDLPFYRPDLHIVITDPHRAGHELRYHPGEANLRMADVVIINKVKTAKKEDIALLEENIRKTNTNAKVIHASLRITTADESLLKGKRVLVIEDGPTLTHGEMRYGAGVLLAKQLGAEIIDPRPFAVGSIKETFRKFPHLENVLPAMGYGKKQVKELEDTINSAECDSVVVATPVDLTKILKINKPATRVNYEYEDVGKPTLEETLIHFLTEKNILSK